MVVKLSTKDTTSLAGYPTSGDALFFPKKIPTCPAGIFFCSSPRALLRKAKI